MADRRCAWARAVGGTTRLERRLRGGQRRRPGLAAWTRGTPGRSCTGRSCPARLAAEVAEPVRRARPGADGLHRLHLRTRRGRLRLPRSSQDGKADIVLAGASRLADLPDHGGLLRRDQGHLARNDDPAHASRPFDADRDGFVLGEGAAVLSWRSWSTPGAGARASTARSRGYADLRQRLPHDRADARGPWRCPRRSTARWTRRGSTAGDSTTSTRTARAPSRTTGTRPPRSSGRWATHAYRVPMSSIKSMVGHSLGAIGAIETGRVRAGARARRGAADRQLRHPGPGVRPGLRAAHRARAAGRRGAVGRQRLRRIPVGDGLLQARWSRTDERQRA